MTTWILIADTGRAKLLTAELPEQAWTVVETFENAGAQGTQPDAAGQDETVGRRQIAAHVV